MGWQEGCKSCLVGYAVSAPGVLLVGVPKLPKCRIPVPGSYRTLPECSVGGVEAVPNVTEYLGRDSYHEQKNPVFFWVRTLPNTALQDTSDKSDPHFVYFDRSGADRSLIFVLVRQGGTKTPVPVG